MGNLFSQLKSLWQGLTLLQKVSISSAAVVTLGLIGLLIYSSSETEYGVLFTNLKADDAKKVVEKLKTSQVPYKLSDQGSTISVPTNQVLDLRVQVAGSGILSGNRAGFKLFDETKWGKTEFDQQIDYLRALQDELSITLESMYEVKNARVHITMPKESVFIDGKKPAKASINLDLATTNISQERVDAMVNLVANAVEGLSNENVIITTTQGRLLTGGKKDQTATTLTMLDKILETRRGVELDISQRVVALLEPIAGEGRVKANVIAEMDFNQVEQTEEKFDPKSAVARVQQATQEFKGSSTLPAGAAGVRANDPTATPSPTPVDSTTTPIGNGRSANTTTFEIDKITKKIVGNGGELKKISVSVLVDEQTTSGKRSPEELQKIQELVAAAVGINKDRGDQVAVQMIPFSQALPVTKPVTPPNWLEKNRDFVKLGIKYGSIFLVSLLLIMMVIRPALRTLSAPVPVPALATATPALLPEGTQVSLTIDDKLDKALKESKDTKLLAEKNIEESKNDSPADIQEVKEEKKEPANEESKEKLEKEIKAEGNTKVTEEKESEETALVSLDKPKTVAELVASVDKSEPQTKLEKPNTTDLAQLPPIETELAAIRAQLIWYSKADPVKVAMTLRSWLRQED